MPFKWKLIVNAQILNFSYLDTNSLFNLWEYEREDKHVEKKEDTHLYFLTLPVNIRNVEWCRTSPILMNNIKIFGLQCDLWEILTNIYIAFDIVVKKLFIHSSTQVPILKALSITINKLWSTLELFRIKFI